MNFVKLGNFSTSEDDYKNTSEFLKQLLIVVLYFSEEEVAGVEFFTPKEAHALITTHDKVHPELKFLWEKLYK